MQVLRYILFPFAMVYGSITAARNFLYRKKIFKSCEFDLPIICIGNLSVGGTGKTPHTEYLIRLLKEEYKIAVLSRGYGRKSVDYIEAPLNAGAQLIGDEPAQFKRKFPEVIVSVEKKRVKGVLNLLYDNPDIEAILLDDAYQHRAIKAGLSILITDYKSPFYEDYLVPMGRLREFRKGKDRADVVIVSKCPKNLSSSEQEVIIKKVNPSPLQQVFFSSIMYGRIYNAFDNSIELDKNIANYDVLVLTGIANPKPLYDELKGQNVNFITKAYRDHYPFSSKDVEHISKIFNTFEGSEKIILTTEKDASRLLEIEEFKHLPIFCIEIKIDFIGAKNFDSRIINYVRANKTNSELPKG